LAEIKCNFINQPFPQEKLPAKVYNLNKFVVNDISISINNLIVKTGFAAPGWKINLFNYALF
jgi:hypothetical protein